MVYPITAEAINAESTKHRLQVFWDKHRERYGKDPEFHRNPDTCVGFLTKEQVHEMFMKPDPDQLLFATGLVFIDNDEVAFFSDDNTLGLHILPKDLGRCGIGGLEQRYGEGKGFPNVDAIIERFFKGKRFINSMEELVEYANSRYVHPDDAHYYC